MGEQVNRQYSRNRLYKAYRRIRYIRYLKKIRKKRLQEQKAKRSADTAKVPARKRSVPGIYRIYRILRYLNYRRKTVAKIRKAARKAARDQRRLERREVKEKMRAKAREIRSLEKLEKEKLKKEKKERKKRRRRLIRYLIRKQGKNLLFILTHPGQFYRDRIHPKIRSLKEKPEERNQFLIIASNSTVYFLLSYLVIFITGLFVTVWASFQFNYKTILFYYKVYYDIQSSEWFADSVKLLYSTMPLTGLFFGIVFLIIYSNIRWETFKWKLFFMWGYIHGFTIFFGALLIGTLMNKGFGYVIIYMYYMDTGKLIFSLLALFVLVSVGLLSVKSLLISANIYFNRLSYGNRTFFIFSQFVIPLVIGMIIIMLLKIPDNIYYSSTDSVLFEIIKTSTLLLVLIPVLFTYNTYQELYFDETPRQIKLNWKPLVALLIVFLLFRLGLSGGIRFG